MPIGPNGEVRHADPVACAVQIGKIATGLAEEQHEQTARAVVANRGHARARALSAERRSEIARKAARARWDK